jgi:sporulation protein YlmC with PRC-barrel domain
MISTAALLMLAQPSVAQNSSAPKQPQTQQQTQKNAQATPSANTQAPRTTAQRLEFYTVKTGDLSAHDLIGKRVYNTANENIGEIEDLILDNGHDLKAIIVGVGGFLGVGERDVAIAPSSMTIQKQTDGSERVIVAATKDNLKNAPEFKRSSKTG